MRLQLPTKFSPTLSFQRDNMAWKTRRMDHIKSFLHIQELLILETISLMVEDILSTGGKYKHI